MPNKRSGLIVYALLLTAAFSFRAVVARFLANDQPVDGQIYAQIARNILEQHIYSHATEPPYEPSLIRLPGYPLFLAGVYSVFGHTNNTAVRIVQALVDTASCALLSLVAFLWEPDEKLKRRTSISALALAAVCPFTAIYVGTILTETLTIFFAVAMCLTATLAFKATTLGKGLLLWVATGILGGVAVLFRPDNGLFVAAIGITLVISALMRSSRTQVKKRKQEIFYRFSRASYLGAMFSLAFCLVLVPWTIRNHRVFHVFQPLAPAHAEMPGEFVPRGYLAWVRTWLDDGRYIGPVLWSLDETPIKLQNIPNRAFDSAEEKQRVAALLEKYNHPPDEQDALFTQPDSQEGPTPLEDRANQNKQTESATPEDEPNRPEKKKTGDEADETDEADKGDESDAGDQGDEADQNDENPAPDSAISQPVEMTPEIDAGFAQIAQERIARHPVRYFLWVPVKRAYSLWFDTHSQYYPFEGELLPLADLDYDIHQQFWLPLFAALTFAYTLLGILGGWFLWDTRDFMARQWLLLAALIIFLRIGFFSTLENPEPRYVVEIFPFLSILGGIALSRTALLFKISKTT